MSRSNLFTTREYAEVKNTPYHLITFRIDDGSRTCTYSGYSMYDVVKELQIAQSRGQIGIIATEEQAKVINRYESNNCPKRWITYQEALKIIQEVEKSKRADL
jgi:hypothetical protein